MGLTFLNPVFLFALPALGVPILVHLLSRRRYDVVDWGAMRFLKIDPQTQQRQRLDQWLLMLLRMGLLALLLTLLAGPQFHSAWLNRFSAQPNKDTVLILDGSASMSLMTNKQSLFEQGRDKARQYVRNLGSGDRFQLLIARRSPSNISLSWGNRWGPLEGQFDKEIPYDSLDVAAAVARACELLHDSTAAVREIAFITDGQRKSWADADLYPRLKSQMESEGDSAPTLRIVEAGNVVPNAIRNAGIDSMSLPRTLIVRGQSVEFEGKLDDLNRDPSTLEVRVLLDHRPIGKAAFGKAEPNGKIPFQFVHRFTEPGNHVVQFRVSGDDYPADDTFDIALRIVASIDVSILDSKFEGSTAFTPSQFLADALAPLKDPQPLFHLNRVKELMPSSKSSVLLPKQRNRVWIWCNPGSPHGGTINEMIQSVSNGNGLLIAAGDGFDPKAWNDSESARTLLPAKPLKTAGDETDFERAPSIDPRSLSHPALKMFRDQSELLSARFPKYWELSTEGVEPSQILAKLSNGKPLFIEKTLGQGKVILSAIPLDNRWRTNLTDLGDYVRLLHELTLYLASESTAENNQPPRSRLILPDRIGPDALVNLTPPFGESMRRPYRELQEFYRDATMPGVYSIQEESQPVEYLVLQSDRTENDLKYATAEDWKALKDALGGNLLFKDEIAANGSSPSARTISLRLPLLLLLLAFLFAETWFARRQSVG